MTKWQFWGGTGIAKHKPRFLDISYQLARFKLFQHNVLQSYIKTLWILWTILWRDKILPQMVHDGPEIALHVNISLLFRQKYT